MTTWYRRPSIGLALGGGGARGLAHIGVLKVFQSEGIPIDCIAGTSMGGLIACLYAAGISPTNLEKEAINLSRFSRLIKLLNPTPPRRGLLSADRIKEYLENLVGYDKKIEELKIPLSVVSVDLKTRKEVLIQSGSVIDAILATTCVPGIFSPIERENALMIDGGILNNVPADVVRRIGAEVVIAVDVNYVFDENKEWGQMAASSTLSKILPDFAIDIYQAVIIMTSAITEEKLRKAKPDFILHPQIPPDVNIFFGFTHARNSILAGEDIARRLLPDIQLALKPRFRKPGKLHLIDQS